MKIPKMLLKQSLSHSKWVSQANFPDCLFSVFGSSNFDTAFLPDCTKVCSVFSAYWIGNLMGIPKVCLKLSFSHYKWVLQAILSLTVLENCFSVSSNFDTAFDYQILQCFSGYWIGNFMRNPEMCLKLSFSHYKWISQAILSLTVLENCLSDSSNIHTVFLPACTKFCSVFSGYWIGNFMRIPEMCLKLSFSHYKWILQAILSLTVLENCLSDSSNIHTVFLPACTKFCSAFSDYWIGNFLRISKMHLKQSFSHIKWVSQSILSMVGLKPVSLTVKIFTPLFSLTVLYFVVFFQVIE